jgi:hypothetical protein
MTQSSPLLTFSNTILWLKVLLTAATLVLLYLRHKKASTSGVSSKAYPFRTQVSIVIGVLFSFAVFHNLGTFPGGTFVHHSEMFHYYLGAKYFKELGYYELYNAVIAADTEQDNALAGLPFYTDLKTYQNTQREIVLNDIDRVKNLFSEKRWNAFKNDVSFFKDPTGMPRSPGLMVLLMDHGYNASPASTFILSILTNVIPVTQLRLLAGLDVILVVAMIELVFHTFGFDMGALFSVYFFVNILNDHDYISGSLLRYDWLFYIVVSVCLLEKGRFASASFFLTLSAMIKVFPAVLFYGIVVRIVQRIRTTRAVDKKVIRFTATAGVTGLVLFLLPAVQLGSVLRPWKDFAEKTALHDSGVYVNHLGLRGIVLFEPSHLSFKKFIEAYKNTYNNTYPDDIVRHWQDVKEQEFRRKKATIVFASLFVLVCLTAIIWKRKGSESESVLWPLLLIYTMSYPSHYYYTFLCLFILLFFRRSDSFTAFVPLCLLLLFNISALVTDYFRPSPIVFFTLSNIYLFICLSSILGFELYINVFRNGPVAKVASMQSAAQTAS